MPLRSASLGKLCVLSAGVSALVAVACGQNGAVPATARPQPTAGPASESSGAPAPRPTAEAVSVSPTAVSTPAEVAETPEPVVPEPTATPSPALIPVRAPGPGSGATHLSAIVSTEPEPPDRDQFELALRLRSPALDESTRRVVNPEPVSYEKGHRDSFQVANLSNGGSYTIRATLMVVSEHAYWYVDDRLDLPVGDLEKAAAVFESDIHPLITGAFGDIWNPGVDNDPRLTILHTPLLGVSGYYGSADEYSRQIHPHSNQREMIYMDGGRLNPGSRIYLSVLTHEFQHAIHWNQDAGEDSWVNEGMSEVATELAGYRSLLVRSFLRQPNTQLNYWPEAVGQSAPHYGAAALFLIYIAQRFGGYESLGDLVAEPADGIKGIEAYLEPYGESFIDVFRDWVVANYVDAPEGPFGYPDRRVRVSDVDLLFTYGETEGTLPQFSARYLDLRLQKGDVALTFRGNPEVRQVATRCRSGRYCWWGNRGDSIDTTLTREFDLSQADTATLEFWTWFRLEEDWDYAYVEISDDGGQTWTILEGRHTTAQNPMGNSFGDGLTGSSGDWIQERFDLSPFVGRKVLLRFEYVTDDAAYLDGIVIDDVTIPELGFFDGGEEDLGWHAEGFVRIDNVLRQDYLVQVVEVGADGQVLVREMGLDERNEGQIVIEGFGSGLEHALVVVSPVTRGTHQPARYTLRVVPAEGR